MRAVTVADVMVKPVVTARPETTVGAVHRLLQHARIRHLPVLDGAGLLVGIVSDRDLAKAPSDQTPLLETMTRIVWVLSPDTPIKEAARRFSERRVGAMPVMKGRELVGIASVVDVVGAIGA